MSWLDVLNAAPPRLDLPGATAEVLGWNYRAHLPDNILHRHTFFEVCLVGRYGSGLFWVEGHEHPIRGGDVFFARPDVLHRIQNTSRPLMELFWTSFAFVPAHGASSDALTSAFAASRVLVAPDECGVAAIWDALREVGEARPRADAASPLAALQSALLLSLMRAGTRAEEGEAAAPPMPKRDHAVARLAVRYVHDNLDRRLTIPDIAAQVHVSTRQLGRLMGEFTGTSPAAYIERARMDRARSLLKSSSLPVKAVALQAGYPDVHHFTRVFRRTFAVAPGRFRDGAPERAPDVPRLGELV